MKLIKHFADFLRVTVNLNVTRLENLKDSVDAIETFIKDSDWGPRVWKFIPQGSWAHKTIIKPIEGKEFDADLLVIVEPVEGWEASDYVASLGQIFADSGVYKDKAETWDYCVTINYARQRKIDIAPCVRGRRTEGELEVCNASADAFEQSEPELYNAWMTQKNDYSGGNAFRKVTRLVKYLRDIRSEFNCPSIVLTTLLGSMIAWNDQGADEFADVPAALRTLVGRLDNWLQARVDKPVIANPHLPAEDFAATMSQDAYAAFRTAVSTLRAEIDNAYEARGRTASAIAWQRVFGPDFAKGISVLTKADNANEFLENEDDRVLLEGVVDASAAHDDSIVDRIRAVGRWIWSPTLDRPAHMANPIWPRADVVSDRVMVSATWRAGRNSPEGEPVDDFAELPRHGGLWFDVTIGKGQPLSPEFFVRYRVTNTGAIALALGKGRGGFETPQEGTKRWESLEYRGVHLVEAFVIRRSDSKLVGQSMPFHVMIG